MSEGTGVGKPLFWFANPPLGNSLGTPKAAFTALLVKFQSPTRPSEGKAEKRGELASKKAAKKRVNIGCGLVVPSRGIEFLTKKEGITNDKTRSSGG